MPTTSVPAITDEFRLLMLCARTRLDPVQQQAVRELAGRQLDWEFILGKAYWHSLAPLLYRNLKQICPEHVPADILARFESEYLEGARRNLVLTAELIRVLRILESGGITAVPYKGPALAVQAYGDVAMRKFADLDVVIRPSDILDAKALLISHGYEWRPFKGQVTGANEARNFEFWNEYSFVHPDTNATIDLHWSISHRRFPFDVDLDAMWQRLQRTQLLGQDIRAFTAGDTLLLLCVHGGKDLWWKRIGWICDIAELLAACPDIDWSHCYALAEQTGTRRTLLLGLALAAELLDAPLPESVVERIKTEQKIPELVRHVQHRIFHDPRPGDQLLEHQRFRLRIRERLRDRIPIYRHLISAPLIKLFVPNRKDIELVEIPGAPFMMYYLIRPFRLARRLWSRTLHGKNTAS